MSVGQKSSQQRLYSLMQCPEILQFFSIDQSSEMQLFLFSYKIIDNLRLLRK